MGHGRPNSIYGCLGSDSTAPCHLNIIAKLDRLARNVHFISSLMEAGVDFVTVVDFPQLQIA